MEQTGAKQFISGHKWILNVLLAVLGIVVIVLYYFCGSSCLYLAGTVFGVDLKIWGLLYLSVLTVILVLRQNALACVLLSAGVGGEIFLLGYQIVHQTYCPYCLTLALIIALLFCINLDRRRGKLVLLSILMGFVLMTVFFRGIPLKIEAEGLTLPSFGRGEVKVRLYTDYFCGPCREVEPTAEGILYDLVRKNRINLTFVDVPIHHYTPVYTSFYLFLAQREKSLDGVLWIRKALFRAAEKRIEDRKALEKYLNETGLKATNVPEKAGAAEASGYLKKDGVEGTPTLVVVRGATKTKYSGRSEVLKGLRTLK